MTVQRIGLLLKKLNAKKFCLSVKISYPVAENIIKTLISDSISAGLEKILNLCLLFGQVATKFTLPCLGLSQFTIFELGGNFGQVRKKAIALQENLLVPDDWMPLNSSPVSAQTTCLLHVAVYRGRRYRVTVHLLQGTNSCKQPLFHYTKL